MKQQQQNLLDKKRENAAALLLQSNIRKRRCRRVLEKKKKDYESKMRALKSNSSAKAMEEIQALQIQHDRERLEMEAELAATNLAASLGKRQMQKI